MNFCSCSQDDQEVSSDKKTTTTASPFDDDDEDSEEDPKSLKDILADIKAAGLFRSLLILYIAGKIYLG